MKRGDRTARHTVCGLESLLFVDRRDSIWIGDFKSFLKR